MYAEPKASVSKRRMIIRWRRFTSWIHSGLEKKFSQQEDLSDSQKAGIKIFERALTVKDADLLLAPLSDTIYIEIEDIFIILDGRQLKIINGKYQYDIYLPEKENTRLYASFKKVLEKRRKQMEFKIITKTNRSLNNILDDIAEIRERKREG
jgi:hypothetical protein